MDLITLGLLAALGGLAYVGAQRVQNESKAKKALSDPSLVQGMTITAKPDGTPEVKKDPGAKARAAVVLAAQAGVARPDDLVGQKLPDGSEVISVRRNMWGDAQAVIKRPDGKIVISVPVYTNGDVKYYEMPVSEDVIVRLPDEINGVKLPKINPVVSIGLFVKSLDVKSLIGEIGVGATGRLSSALSEYMQQWHSEHRDTTLAGADLHIAYTKLKNVDPNAAAQLLPDVIAAEIKRSLGSAAGALESAKSWAEHVGGDTRFNKEKERQMLDIANRELQHVAILTEVLKSLGITDISGKDINVEKARAISASIDSMYGEALSKKLQEINIRSRAVSDMLGEGARRASALTGLPGVTNAETMFQIVLEKSGGDPSKFAQALKEVMETMVAAHSSIPATYLNSLEEAAGYSEYARKALEKIKSDPALNAKYEAYKRALAQVKPEYTGRVGIPLELTTGAVMGDLFKAGIDTETLRYLRQRFDLDNTGVKEIYEYAKRRFDEVGRDMNALAPWERAVLALYEARMPPEIVREMLGGAPAGTVSGTVTGVGGVTPPGVQPPPPPRGGASIGGGTPPVGQPPPTAGPSDQRILQDIDAWIKGNMSDADILRRIDEWIRTGQ